MLKVFLTGKHVPSSDKNNGQNIINHAIKIVYNVNHLNKTIQHFFEETLMQ